MKLVLIRHGESAWNLENRFTGWTDVELSQTGVAEAKAAGVLMKEAGLDFDLCYTSYLKRAIHTLNYALDEMDRAWLPVVKAWQLNERHYGALQGLNKSETAEKYGEEQVRVWRRSYDVCPPALEPDDARNPAKLEQYRGIDPAVLPLGESLEKTIERTVPYYEEVIRPQIAAGKRVVIAAHGNSLRALVMYFEKLTPEEIAKVNLPTGIPLVYDLDENLNLVSKTFLGDPEAVAAKMNKVANQGKAKA